MSKLQALANGENFIYIASRVFDFAEKLKAEDIEEAVSNGINRAMRESGIFPAKNAPITFVPFRDTVQKKVGNQETAQLQNDEIELTRKIYYEDIDRLHKLFALVGFFDGFSKDEGICMELGYAYGISKPIILAVTDFIRAELTGMVDSEHIVDPVIEAMASEIVYEYKIEEIEGNFKQQLQASLRKLLARVEEKVYLLGIECTKENQTQPQEYLVSPNTKHDVYIDFGGGMFEWQRTLQEKLSINLTKMGISSEMGDRYYPGTTNPNSNTIRQRGLHDIQKAKYSSIIVTCSDSIEMSSGTAAIQGFCRAIGKKILLYNSKSTNIVADNNYKSSRNLMIDNSADIKVSTFDEIPEAVKKLLLP